jgi:hypothetical protein
MNTPLAPKEGAGAPENENSYLVDFVARELLRFTRNEDEDEVARRIIKEVIRQTRGLP